MRREPTNAELLATVAFAARELQLTSGDAQQLREEGYQRFVRGSVDGRSRDLDFETIAVLPDDT